MTSCFFLVRPTAPQDVFTPEDLREEHVAIVRMIDEFWTRDISPNLAAMHRKEPGVLARLLRKAVELGLPGISIPEAFGGMELDLASVMVAEEALARDASYSVTLGGQAGIGAWPIVYFGSDDQKGRYLPRLAAAEMIAVYALSEPQAGSDALAIRTRAQLTPDSTCYILNGQKAWITNGGIADLFIVFAKVEGAHFTAFIVERGFAGVSTGAEEAKMGLHGSSTTPLFLDNVAVPVANVLGEVGRGHAIAFNVLNLGRLKVGSYAVGASKDVLSTSLRYAKSRVAFGGPIGALGLIRQKLADMAVRLYATESMVWRVVGLIEGASATTRNGEPGRLEAVREFAAECAMVKVYASEALGYIVDEGVQIHGGYGYHRDYLVERAYRDARVYRIFEGTNEINRLLIGRALLKRAACGESELMSTVQEIRRGSTPDAIRAREDRASNDPVTAGKELFRLALGAALDVYGSGLEREQSLLATLSDMAIDVFAMESSSLRHQKLSRSDRGANAADMTSVLVRESLRHLETAALTILSACPGVDPAYQTKVRLLAAREMVNVVRLQQSIAGRLLTAERFVV